MFELEQKEDTQGISTEASESERMEILVKRMNKISRCETIASVVDESIKTVKSIVTAEFANLILIDRNKGVFRSPPLSKIKKDGEIGLSWSKQKALAEKVLATGKPFTFDKDVQASFLVKEIDEKIQQAICLPLKSGKGNIVGILQVVSLRESNALNEESIRLVKLLAQHVACVIESIEQANELESRLREDELLMTEIHHRLKNNLSTITSLIEVDLSEISDQNAIDTLQRTSSRIQSITQVHSLLYQLGTKKSVDLANYFRNLTHKIIDTFSNNEETICISIEADDIQEIEADKAMTCGLIMNELILNAYKHAFSSMQQGEIKILISEDQEENIEIVVSDNGKGIGNNFAIGKEDSIGCWVIKALADRLEGSINVSTENGTRYSLRFSR
ncbi:histidine kinase dimerization/phosphoacceptor domain -containing protein [Fodinibius salsisoli]|uniref:histidine kinase n=1 Tax=Fodinibius salsisoli TaxID=2820877 RepID=A0ABT3PNL8_9BACT|nr:histidine kinase dimerization/phosphoacceptor domain -containing protein [Fodinibius salsisoli]MCW9707445.1 GAF domain-containing protein [Fodinibius salsisoli]